MANAQATLEILLTARNQAAADLKNVVAQLDALRRASANTPLQKMNADVRDARRAYREAQQAVRDHDKAIKEHAKSVQAALTPLRNYRREVGLIIGMLRGSNLLSAITGNSRLGSLASTRLTTVGAAVGLGMAGVGLSFNSLQENITLAFSTMMKAGLAFMDVEGPIQNIGAQANADWTQLLNTARQLPYALSDTLAAGRELFTSGFTMDQATQELTLLGTTLSNLGNYSASSLVGVSNAFANMQQTGVFSMGAINQLMAAGVPIISALAKQLGMTDFAVSQVLGRLNGKVPSDFWMNQINLALQQFAQNTDGTNTMSAALERLRNNFTTSMGAITGGAFNTAENGISSLSNMFDNLTTTISGLDPSVKGALGIGLIGLSSALGLAGTLTGASGVGSGLGAAGGVLSGLGGVAGAAATTAAGGAESGLLVAIFVAIVALIALQNPWTKMFTDIQTNTKTVSDNSRVANGNFTGTFTGTMNVAWGTLTGVPVWFANIIAGAALVVHLWGDWLWSAAPPDIVVNSSVVRTISGRWGGWSGGGGSGGGPPDIALGNVLRYITGAWAGWSLSALPPPIVTSMMIGRIAGAWAGWNLSALPPTIITSGYMIGRLTVDWAGWAILPPQIILSDITRNLTVTWLWNSISSVITGWVDSGVPLQRSIIVTVSPAGGGSFVDWINNAQALARVLRIQILSMFGDWPDFWNWLYYGGALARTMHIQVLSMFGDWPDFWNWMYYGGPLQRTLNLSVTGMPGVGSSAMFVSIITNGADDFQNWIKGVTNLIFRDLSIQISHSGDFGATGDFYRWLLNGGVLNRTLNIDLTGVSVGGTGGGVGGANGPKMSTLLFGAASALQGVAAALVLTGIGLPEGGAIESIAALLAGLGALSQIAGFAQGGIVPGAMGAPMLAVVHGGEEVVPLPQAGRGGRGDVHIHNYNPIIAGPSADQWFRQMMDKAWRQGGSPQPA